MEERNNNEKYIHLLYEIINIIGTICIIIACLMWLQKNIDCAISLSLIAVYCKLSYIGDK